MEFGDRPMTVVNRIIDFLKNNQGETFTPKEIALSINANPNTVRGRLSELSRGKVKNVKITKLKKTQTRASEWRLPNYLGKKISDYRLWKVSFKLMDTLKHRNSKHGWDKKIMNLEAYLIGLAPRLVEQQEVKKVVGTKLFSKVLDEMSSNGIFLWNSVDESSSIYIDSSVINENPLDKQYNSEWNGKINFVNDMASSYEFDISIQVLESEWS